MQKLFSNLMNLCEEDRTKFYYTDTKVSIDKTARIFNYNYASYSDWLKPDALECRGIMFEIDNEQNPVRILSRPMPKFFNIGENPFTLDLDFSKVDYLMEKADGSLISSYVIDDYAYFKSKGSVQSDQSYEANRLLNSEEYSDIRTIIKESPDTTFNFEYVAPENRIVLQYDKPELILLNARDNETGKYVPYEDLEKHPVTRKYLVKRYKATGDWYTKAKESVGVEGYVGVMLDGLWFKVKSDWYISLHRTKDSITSNENLFEAVVAGSSDDLKSMFYGDDWAIAKIEAFEKTHLEELQKQVQVLLDVYTELRDSGCDRKTFALNGQVKLKEYPQLFSILMQTYTNGFDYETVIGKIDDMFLKYYEKYIPKEYK